MPTIPQAGAIAVLRDDTRPLFLVVTAKKNPTHWVFPKGHIEQGETPEAAAVRELREEAGVEGRLLAPVGTDSFRSGDEDVEVTYYLVLATTPGTEMEQRRRRWLPHAEARALLSFDNARRLLDAAVAQLADS